MAKTKEQLDSSKVEQPESNQTPPVIPSENSEIPQQPEQSDSTQTVPADTQPASLTVAENTEILQQTETVVVFRVTKPMVKREYEELSARVRAENQASGLKIVLAPAIVDGVEISG